MTTPATRAHLRLIHSDQVQIRTVRRETNGGIGSGNGGHGGLGHAIEIDGKRFESKNQARRILGISYKRIEALLASGEAKHL